MKHRLLLLFATLAITMSSMQAQTKYETEGDAAFGAGLYKQAYDMYRKAMKQHRSTDLVYKMGDASRMANNYADAVRHYRTIANGASAYDYPDCAYYLAQMYKSNNQVDSAVVWFKRYIDSPNTNAALETRARQELGSCQWVMDNEALKQQNIVYDVSHEGQNINTANSESGAVLVGDSLLIFSSIQEVSATGSRNAIDFDLVLMQIYDAPVAINGRPGSSGLNEWGLNDPESHTGNVAVDVRNNTVYFTRGRQKEGDSFNTINCAIYRSQLKDGKWQRPKKLGGDVNLPDCSSTQPTVGYLPDSSVILYFSSNRPGGVGGFDIWYTVINDKGNPSPCVNLGIPVNSEGDEITPFYDNNIGTLYFSSDWHYGYGGYDVFSSVGSRDTWEKPHNAGPTLNSPANDIHFTANVSNPTKGYLTSNRRGSYYVGDNTCCNDIYSWESHPYEAPAPEPEPVPVQVVRKGEVHNLLPISLYFHNDEPDPKSELYTTSATYFQTYNRYMFMRNQYKKAFDNVPDSCGHDSILYEIDRFFDHDVHDNCEDFETFINLLIDDLRAGRRVSITVEGYASPVHTGTYNQKISQRRIGTIVNQLMEYDHGKLKPFLGTQGLGSLQIREVAYGSSKANQGVSTDRGNAAQSVYSVEASKERRIEIQDYQYLEDDSTLISCLRIPWRAMHIGTYTVGGRDDIEVHIPHSAIREESLEFVNVGSPDVKVVGYSKLLPGRDLTVYLRMDNRKAEPTVSSFLPLTLRVKGEHVTQTMFLEYSVEKVTSNN